MIGQIRTTLLEVVQVAVGEARKLHAELKPDFAKIEKKVENWIERVEATYELAGVAALVQYEASRLGHDTTKYGEEQCAPSGNPAVLEELLKKRGVL